MPSAQRHQTSAPFVSFALCIQTAGGRCRASTKTTSAPCLQPGCAQKGLSPPQPPALTSHPVLTLQCQLCHSGRSQSTFHPTRAGQHQLGEKCRQGCCLPCSQTPLPLLAERGPPSSQPTAPALPGTAMGHTVAVTQGRGASLDTASEPGPNPNRCPAPRQPQLLIRPWQHHAPAGEAVVSAGLEGAGARGAGMWSSAAPGVPGTGPPGPRFQHRPAP